MTSDALIAEGERLARPCVHLRTTGEPATLAAVWRGEGLIPPPGERYEHWLTIDCRFLPPNTGPSSGCLSVYTNDDDRDGAVAHSPSLSLSLARGGRPLYAHSTTSLPPMEAVFKYGSPAVAEWLASTGWHANTIWDRRFPDRALVEAYADALRANMPSDGQSVFAVLGGWHLSWPEGDWQELVDYPLIVLTLAESEPWVEAFGVDGGYRVIQRIS